MSRVVVGAYRPGISLRELHKAMPETWHGYNGESPQGDVEEIFTKIDVQAVESAVYVIPWEESVNGWDSNIVGVFCSSNVEKMNRYNHALGDTNLYYKLKDHVLHSLDTEEGELTAIDVARRSRDFFDALSKVFNV